MSALTYDQVDHHESEHRTQLIRMLDDQNQYRSNRLIKQTMFELLDVHPGQAILEVGAGTGDDTRKLFWRAQPGGTVLGIDTSNVMVAEATRRANEVGVPVTFQVGDVQQLTFPDASFDRIWSERTFIWLTEPDRALREMVRVTKPGGKIVVSTYDIMTGIEGGFEPDLNQRIEHLIGIGMPSPRIGRELPSMFHEAGLTDITVRPHLVEHEAESPNAPIRLITGHRVEQARQSGVFSAAEAERYLCSFEGAIERGTFFNVVIAFVVCGTRGES